MSEELKNESAETGEEMEVEEEENEIEETGIVCTLPYLTR